MRTAPPRLAIACVADSKPKYLFEALRLAHAVFLNPHYRGVADLFIGVFPNAPAEYLATYERLGATIVPLEKYTDRHGPSNKLAVLKSPVLETYDYVALFDCDLLPVEPFEELLHFDGIQAKPADLYTLDESILMQAFELCGAPFPQPSWRTSIDDVPIPCYCNTGLVLFSKSIFRRFVQEWLRYNNILLANIEVFGRHAFFLDQASFCVCLAGFLDEFRALPLAMNFPGHLPRDIYPEEALRVVPKIVHYHDRVDMRTGALDLTELPNVQGIVRRLNDLTVQSITNLYDGRLFWDASYAMRGNSATRSARDLGAVALVRCVVSRLQARSILDLGCGTLCPDGLPSSSAYHGVDFSVEAIAIARAHYPQYTFRTGDIVDSGASEDADLALLLDVIPAHDRQYAARLVGTAIARARKAVLVSLEMADVDDALGARQSAARYLASIAKGFVFAGQVGAELFFLRAKDNAKNGNSISPRRRPKATIFGGLFSWRWS